MTYTWLSEFLSIFFRLLSKGGVIHLLITHWLRSPLRGSTSCRRALRSECVWPRIIWAATTQSADTLSAAVCSLFLFSCNFSPWAQSVQSTCFTLLYSPTLQLQLTRSRPRSMGAPYLTTWRKRGASSSKSRWDWRRSLHFRVRMDPPHTTPCQVNIKELLNSLSHGTTPLCSAFPMESCSVRWSVYTGTSGGIKCDNPSFHPGAFSQVLVVRQQCWVRPLQMASSRLQIPLGPVTMFPSAFLQRIFILWARATWFV